MKSVNLFFPILLFCFFETICAYNQVSGNLNADKWLNMTIRYIESQCELNANSSVFRKESLIYYIKANMYLRSLKEQGIETSDFHFHNIYSPELVEALKNYINVIQNCLNNEDRLDFKGLITVLYRSLNELGSKVLQIDPVSTDDYIFFITNVEHTYRFFTCVDSYLGNPLNGNFKSADMPFKLFFPPARTTIYQFLTQTSLTNSSTTCEDIISFDKCINNIVDESHPNLRKMYKILLMSAERANCDNFHEETISNSIEEIDFGYNKASTEDFAGLFL